MGWHAVNLSPVSDIFIISHLLVTKTILWYIGALAIYFSVGIFANNLIWIAVWVSFPRNGCLQKSPGGARLIMVYLFMCQMYRPDLFFLFIQTQILRPVHLVTIYFTHHFAIQMCVYLINVHTVRLSGLMKSTSNMIFVSCFFMNGYNINYKYTLLLLWNRTCLYIIGVLCNNFIYKIES